MSSGARGKVRTPEGWAALEVRTETIAVRGSAPVSYQVRASAHGQLISAAQPEILAIAVPKSSGSGTYALALAMTGLRPSKPGWYFELQSAHNWDEFRAALH